MLSKIVDAQLEADLRYLVGYFIMYTFFYLACMYVIEHSRIGGAMTYGEIPTPLDIEVLKEEPRG